MIDLPHCSTVPRCHLQLNFTQLFRPTIIKASVDTRIAIVPLHFRLSACQWYAYFDLYDGISHCSLHRHFIGSFFEYRFNKINRHIDLLIEEDKSKSNTISLRFKLTAIVHVVVKQKCRIRARPHVIVQICCRFIDRTNNKILIMCTWSRKQ